MEEASKMFRSRYSSLIGMIIALCMFFGIDRLLARQARIARQSSDFQQYMVWIIGIGLAIGVLLFVLSWLTLSRSQRSYQISFVFIVIGLLVYIYPILYLWIGWLHLPYLYNYDTPISYTGIFISVLGVLHLSLPK